MIRKCWREFPCMFFWQVLTLSQLSSSASSVKSYIITGILKNIIFCLLWKWYFLMMSYVQTISKSVDVKILWSIGYLLQENKKFGYKILNYLKLKHYQFIYLFLYFLSLLNPFCIFSLSSLWQYPDKTLWFSILMLF